MNSIINRIATIMLIILTLIFVTTAIIASDKNKTSEKDIIDIALEAGTFKTLAKALTEANLVKTLKGDGPFTVFAPTDEAFNKLPKGTIENLLKNKEALTNVLLYHVVKGKVNAQEVIKLNNTTTLSDANISINVKDGQVYINKSLVTSADINASNGIIHIIDNVLIPKSN